MCIRDRDLQAAYRILRGVKNRFGSTNEIGVFEMRGDGLTEVENLSLIHISLVQQYEIVVYGDINGDGKVSNLDLVLMQKQILGIESQSGSRLEAANVSKDGGISNKDLVILQKHILGISQIDQ